MLSPFFPLVTANTIAFLVANAANFLVAHLWVFGSKGRDSDILAKYGAVLLISLLGVALNDAFVWIGVMLLHANLVMSKVAATLAVWSWNYWARAQWVYGRN